MKALSADQMKNMDQKVIQEFGIPALVLMENAGRSIAELVVKKYPEAKKALIVCGVGNNGGDGFVIARHLHNRGVDVSISLLGDADQLKSEASVNFRILKKMKLRFISSDELSKAASDSDVLVDAIFGIGLSRNIEGDVKSAIMTLNRSGKSIVAVDVPSGLHSDTGEVMGESIKATLTGVLGLIKTGLMEPKAKPFVGEVEILDISIPRELLNG